MSVIATVSVPAEDFALGVALSDNPGIRVRLERVVPVGGAFVPYFWASNDHLDDIRAALAEDSNIESFKVVDSTDGEALVRATWSADVDGLVDALAETEGVIVEGEGETNAWRLRLQFDDHDRLSAFYRTCVDRGIPLDLESVYNPGLPPDGSMVANLTETQRETLRVALAEGYFDVPRRTNLVELAEKMGISDSALSQRLRRATAKLLSATLPNADDTDG